MSSSASPVSSADPCGGGLSVMDGIALLTRASEEKVAFVPDEKIRYGVLVLGRLIKAAIANAAAR